MSVAPYSKNSTGSKTRRSRRIPKVTKLFADQVNEKQQMSKKVVQFQRSTPDELKNILRLEKLSLIVMLSLIMTTLGMYASAVYAPKLWSKDYRKLEKLQSDERNLVTNNETLKNHLAQEAKNPAEGLTDVHPFQSIFLPTTKEKLTKREKQHSKPRDTTPKEDPKNPISY